MTIQWHEWLSSTMDTAHALAEAGAAHGAAVAAREQGAGRGRRGRAWHSPRGGLWMSVICRPGDPAAVEPLSLRAGLAVARTLEGLVTGLPPVTVKWPNDLLVAGRKLAGILCEARWEGSRPSWVVVGIGLNVTNPIPRELGDDATSLAACGTALTPEELAGPLARAIADASLQAGPLTRAERDALAARGAGV